MKIRNIIRSLFITLVRDATWKAKIHTLSRSCWKISYLEATFFRNLFYITREATFFHNVLHEVKIFTQFLSLRYEVSLSFQLARMQVSTKLLGNEVYSNTHRIVATSNNPTPTKFKCRSIILLRGRNCLSQWKAKRWNTKIFLHSRGKTFVRFSNVSRIVRLSTVYFATWIFPCTNIFIASLREQTGI